MRRQCEKSTRGRSGINREIRYETTWDTTTALDPDTTLVGLTVSSGTLSPAFAKRTTEYVVDIDDNVGTITITPTLRNEMGFVAYLDENGTAHRDQRPYSSALDLALTAPETTVRVQVTSSDRTRSKTYTVTVRRIGRPAKITRLEFFNLPSREHYEPGDTVDVVVRFDKSVEVTGTPTVIAKLGQRRNAGVVDTLTYIASESQAKQLLFRGLSRRSLRAVSGVFPGQIWTQRLQLSHAVRGFTVS